MEVVVKFYADNLHFFGQAYITGMFLVKANPFVIIIFV